MSSGEKFSLIMCGRAVKKYFSSIREYMVNLFPAYFLLPLPIMLLEHYMPVNDFIALGYVYNVFNGALAVSTIPTSALVAHYVVITKESSFFKMLRMNQRISTSLFLYVYIGGICFLRLINPEITFDSFLLLTVGLLGIFESNQKPWMFSKIQNGVMGYPKYFMLSVGLQSFALLFLRTSHVSSAIVIAVLIQIVIVDIVMIYIKSGLSLNLSYGYIFLFILAFDDNRLFYLGLVIAMIFVFEKLRLFYANEYYNPGDFS